MVKTMDSFFCLSSRDEVSSHHLFMSQLAHNILVFLFQSFFLSKKHFLLILSLFLQSTH